MNIKNILSEAGININGDNSYDIRVNGGIIKQAEISKRIDKEGFYGLCDSYVDGDWDCEKLDELFYRLLKVNATRYFENHPAELKRYKEETEENLQQGIKAKENIQMHYDTIPLEVYQATLDKRLTYTCGYWKDAKNLDDAQEAKLDLICKKLGLEKGMKVLDLGCGWGCMSKFAVEKYSVEIVGLTLSENQKKFIDQTKGDLPIEVKLMSYEKLKDSDEKFDRIIALGIFEHVGHKNYRMFMEVACKVLKDGGLMLTHNFGGLYDTPNTKQPETRWIEKHFFQNMELPSLGQMASSAQGLFNIQDVQNFGRYYYPTLMAWAENFKKNWPKLKGELKEKYGEKFSSDRFYRFWTFYLLSCAGGFRSGKFQLWQVVFSKGDIGEVYQAVR